MPGWHEATKPLQDSGDIQMVGIVEEQHPDRARLFMQWKEMGWPILVDPLGLLEVPYVPITLLIDEQGVIRKMGRLDSEKDVEAFVAESFPKPEDGTVADPEGSPIDPDQLKPADTEDAGSWKKYARALTLWGGETRLADAIDAFSRAVELDPGDGGAEFRLGVTYRMRYDEEGGDAADFRHAVEHWTRALEIDPNNYIWMRRLQQFGPRQEKPYPFYDWVSEARADIEARGDTPTPLPVEPRGAELAHPAKQFTAAAPEAKLEVDGRIHRDEGELVRIEATSVPLALEPSSTARIHLEFRPDAAKDIRWNNEVGGLEVLLDPPDGWEVDQRALTVLPPADSPTSDEIRRVEFEIQSPAEMGDSVALKAYVLYYVCEGRQGQCLYRRQDISLPLISAH